jgi:hypothetical protein
MAFCLKFVFSVTHLPTMSWLWLGTTSYTSFNPRVTRDWTRAPRAPRWPSPVYYKKNPNLQWMLSEIYNNEMETNLPKHGDMWHVFSFLFSPLQSCPPCFGSGFVQFLTRDLIPLSHDVEQSLHVLQGDQPPWTTRKVTNQWAELTNDSVGIWVFYLYKATYHIVFYIDCFPHIPSRHS